MPRGLGEVLAESGDITFRRLRRASDWRRAHGGTLDRALLETGAVREETLLDALARVTGLPSVSRERLLAASREAVAALPADARRRLRALPFDRRGGVLLVAVVDPGNPVLETGLVASTGCEVRLFVTAEPILEDLLDRWETASPPAAPAPVPVAPAAPLPASGAARAPAEPGADDPFGRLARTLLVGAIEEGAEAVEIGKEGPGAVVRSYAGSRALSSRALPPAILDPLVAWLLEKSRPAGPFDEGGILLERAHRRVRAHVTSAANGGAWLVLQSAAASAAEGWEICLHEAAGTADVFCPACGAPL